MQTNLNVLHRIKRPRPTAQHRCWVLAVLFGVVSILLTVSNASAQDAPDKVAQPDQTPKTSRSHPNEPELWNANQMMEDAVSQIARRYNLNPAQENYTRMLLRERTLAFLEQHETEVRQLLKESIDFRLGLKSPTPEALKDWASRAMPIYQSAQETILSGNEEWREILSEDQIKIHDSDLSLMKTNFTQVTKMLDGWKEGKGAFGRRTQSQTIKSSGDSDATEGAVSQQGRSFVERRTIEANWLAYTNKFIDTYKLNKEKAIAARAGIHKDALSKAMAYRNKRKAQFSQIETDLRAPRKKEEDPKETRRHRIALEQVKSDLERPIRQMFVEMNDRLMQLPTSSQLGSADPLMKKDLQDLYTILAGDADPELSKAPRGTKPTTQPSQPTTQPEETGTPSPAKPEPQNATKADTKPASPENKPSAKPKPVKPTAPPSPKPDGKKDASPVGEIEASPASKKDASPAKTK